jgi:hypothetical protein
MCGTLGNISLGCRTGVGGVDAFYITQFDNITGYTVGTSSVVTGMTNSGSWYKVESDKNSGSFEYKVTGSDTNVFYDVTVNMNFSKLETTKRNIVRTITVSNVIIVAKMNDGGYWLLGKDRGLYQMDGGSKSGAAMGDMTGYTVILKGQEVNDVYEIGSAIIATLPS